MLKFAVSVLLLCALRAPGYCSVVAGDGGGSAMDSFRLPDNTRPELYELRFTPRFDGLNSTFGGAANITISVVAATKVITLNAKDLNVTGVRLTDVSNAEPRELRVSEIKHQAHNEQLEIHLRTNVPKGKTVLVGLSFEARLRTDMTGLYLSSYEEGNVTK